MKNKTKSPKKCDNKLFELFWHHSPFALALISIVFFTFAAVCESPSLIILTFSVGYIFLIRWAAVTNNN